MRRIWPATVILSVTTIVLAGPADAGVPPAPPPPVEYVVVPFNPGTCLASTTTTSPVDLGRAIRWTNDEVDAHTFSDDASLWSYIVDGGTSLDGEAAAAATFSVTCDGGPSTLFRVRIRARKHPASPDFKVTWATSAADPTWLFNVDYRIGSRPWRSWKSGSTAHAGTFHGVKGRTYTFRSQVENQTSSATSEWSPRRSVSP
jgi:hypothetical protein